MDPKESREGRLPPFYDEWQKKLGPATGPAKELSPNNWVRTFKHPGLPKVTTVTYFEDHEAGRGTIDWADGPAGPPHVWPNTGPPSPPPPAPTPPAPPAPPSCGKVMAGYTANGDDPDLGSKVVSG